MAIRESNKPTYQPPPRNGVVPNPDPSTRTIDTLQRDILAAREIVESKIDGKFSVVETRLAGMDKAIELLQQATNRLPTHIKEEVAQLKDLHEEKFTSVEARTGIQFGGIATQFQERDKRTEQLSLADKTAIAAALQAQKEAAGAQNESNTTANNKMEASFVKLIEQLQTLLQAVTRNTDDKINDIKSRLDQGEGSSKGSDRTTDRTSTVITLVIAAIVALVVVVGAIATVVLSTRAPSPIYLPGPPNAVTR